jgi:uncharacterized membrane protein YedE/YeeE
LSYFYLQNRLLGASSTYQAVWEALDPKKEDFDVLGSQAGLDLPKLAGDPAPQWRVYFWLGLFFGGLLAGSLAGPLGPLELPGLGNFLGMGLSGQLFVLFIGGILIGFGTRASGGCTSGHAITGISGLQWPSLLATLVFFAVGVATSFFIQHFGV